MKEIVKEHPLRPIILQFDLKKQVLDFEEKALQAYYRMHDRSWDTRQKLLQHTEALSEIDMKSTELEYELLLIKQQTDFLEVGFKIDENIELPIAEDSFSIDIADYYHNIDLHNEELIALHGQMVAEIKWYEEWADYIYDNEDWFDEQDREGDRLIHQVFSHYDEVSVDIISLDRDQQEFFGVLGDIRQIQEEYFDYGEIVSGQYNRIQAESEEVYRRGLRIREYVNKNFPRE